MDIAGVVDLESLQAYFDDWPEAERKSKARRVAYFAAVSVAPFGLRIFANKELPLRRDVSSLTIFGGIAISGVASTWPYDGGDFGAPSVADAAVRAADAAARIAYDLGSFSDPTVLASVNAIDAASLAAAVTFKTDATAHVGYVVARAADAVANASNAPGSVTTFWERLRDLLSALEAVPKGPLLAIDLEQEAHDAWVETRRLLKADEVGRWQFWIIFFERVLAGRDIHAAQLASILKGINEDDWLDDPVKVNSLFDEVLEIYEADDAGNSGASQRPTIATQHVKAIRSQISTLRDFLDAEYLNLSGHNARSAEQDDVLELLRDLKAIVDKLMERLDGAEDEGRALVLVQENLPAVFEKAGELAIVEAEPLVSATTVTMAATIKMLVDSGADPKLATQIAMGDAAAKKLSPSWRRLFPWLKNSGDSE